MKKLSIKQEITMINGGCNCYGIRYSGDQVQATCFGSSFTSSESCKKYICSKKIYALFSYAYNEANWCSEKIQDLNSPQQVNIQRVLNEFYGNSEENAHFSVWTGGNGDLFSSK